MPRPQHMQISRNRLKYSPSFSHENDDHRAELTTTEHLHSYKFTLVDKAVHSSARFSRNTNRNNNLIAWQVGVAITAVWQTPLDAVLYNAEYGIGVHFVHSMELWSRVSCVTSTGSHALPV